MTELIVEIAENKYMLRLGDNDYKSKLTLQDVTGRLEEFDIWLEIKSENDIKRLKKIFHVEGENVKKLAWLNRSKYEITAADVIEMLNCFTKVEILELSSWHVKFTGEYCGKLQLPNIKSLKIYYCDKFIFDFLTHVLPENSIPDLTIGNVEGIEDILHEFIKKQTAIKRLTLCEDFNTIEPFKLLNLDFLYCPINHDDKKVDQQRKFLHDLIKSQANLKSLEITDADYKFSFVNNEIFTDICALSKLENLAINIEILTPDGIATIENLTSLKTLKIEAGMENTGKLKTLKKFSAIQNTTLRNLTLNMLFDVPSKFYEAIGRNYQNLKSLTITLETEHRFSLFAKAFPNLEKLDINFGDANHPVEFQQIYNAKDNIMLPKLKILLIYFSGQVDLELWLKFLSAFPNLLRLEINSTFPFTADFINQFANNLNTIKSLELLRFEIENMDTFTPEVIDALKLLRSKLNYVSLYLTNSHGRFKKDSINYFSYKPLIEKLKSDFLLSEIRYTQFDIYKNLIIEAGKCELKDDLV